MEIRIGIQHAPREIVVETDSAADEVASQVQQALTAGGALTLTDSKGRTVIVPAEKIAYAELSSEQPRRVGFLG